MEFNINIYCLRIVPNINVYIFGQIKKENISSPVLDETNPITQLLRADAYFEHKF